MVRGQLVTYGGFLHLKAPSKHNFVSTVNFVKECNFILNYNVFLDQWVKEKAHKASNQGKNCSLMAD